MGNTKMHFFLSAKKPLPRHQTQLNKSHALVNSDTVTEGVKLFCDALRPVTKIT